MIVLAALPAHSADITSQAFEQAETYEFGQSRESLSIIEDWIRGNFDNDVVKKDAAERLAGLLHPKTTLACKDFACRQLALIGSGEQVSALATLLNDQQTADMARYALERIPEPSVDRVLIEALRTKTGTMRVGMINSLANRKSHEAVPSIAPLLEDEDIQTAEAAAFALGSIGGERASSRLSDVFGQSQGRMRLAIAQAWLDCADQDASEGKQDTAREVYTRMYSTDEESVLRVRALASLISMTKDMSLLSNALGDEDPRVQGCAAQMAVELPGTKTTASLSVLVRRTSSGVRPVLLRVLGDRGDRSALRTVKRWSQDRDDSVRLAALEALGKLGDVSCVTLLAKRLAHAEASEVAIIRKGLDGLPDNRVNRAIIRQAGKPNPKVQVQLLQSLTVRNATESVPLLLKLTQSSDRKVRVESFRALSELASLDDVPTLLDQALDADASDSKDAEGALIKLTRRLQQESSVGVIVQSRYLQEQDISRKAALIRILGGMGDRGALETLSEATEHPDESIRYEAIRALAGWLTPEPITTLLRVAESDDKATHQVLALRGYIDQIGVLDVSDTEKVSHYEKALTIAKHQPERKRALGAIAHIKSYEALSLVASCLDDVSLREEAVSAGNQIARLILAASPEPVRDYLDQVMSLEISPTQKAQTQEIMGLTEYLTDWDVSDFYQSDDKGASLLFDIAFDPECATGALVQWKPMPSGLNPEVPWFMDLATALGAGTNRVAYLRTQLVRQDDEWILLRAGSDDGIKIWVNGELVLANNAIRGYSPDTDRARVHLKKDSNEILVKVTQEHSGWGASVRAQKLDEHGALKDVVAPVESALVFDRVKISDERFEAASSFDVNNNGTLDIVSGEYWYEGPDFKKRHKICDIAPQGEYYDDFGNFPMDVNGDGYTDIVTGGFWGCTLRWRENPQGTPTLWKTHDVDVCGNIETFRCWDVDGDGFPEVVPNAGGNLVAYRLIRDQDGKGTGAFSKHVLKQGGIGHGIGFGDINGDGRGDFIAPDGWLQAPDNPWEEPWTWHPEFQLGSASVPILVHDVDGDGLADLIVGGAHSYGLNWWRQELSSDGTRSWSRHEIDPNRSQYHDMMLFDLDNDGTLELVTGKRYRAHNGMDPGADDPVGVYYFKIQDGGFKRATLDYGLASESSGVGIYFWIEDVDGNGWKDIIAPGKEGLYLFLNSGKRASE